MPMLAFTGSSSRDDDNQAGGSARLINCFLEQNDDREFLKPVPGMVDFADIDDVFLRAMEGVKGAIYAACGGNLYRISREGVITALGAVSDGDTAISSNNGKVTIAANGTYYVWDGEDLEEPTTGAFSEVGSVTFVGQFTVISELNGRRFSWSGVADPETFDALDFASSEGKDDNILRIMGINGNLVVFNAESREVWYLTGSSDSATAFSRIPGAVSETGLKSAGLLAKIDQGAFFVGDDNVAYITDGQSQRAISNRAVETSIVESTPQRCFFYESEGHKFGCIQFSDRPAWCHDFSSGKWHERQFGQTGIWPVVETVKLDGKWHFGTDLGAISQAADVQLDGDEPLRKRAVSKTLYMDGKRNRIAELELYANPGRGETSCWIRLSKDNGITWGEEKSRSLGNVGEYERRINWRALGQFRQVTAELNWSDDQTFRNEVRLRLR